MKGLWTLLFLATSLFAETTVKLIATWPNDSEYFTQALKAHHVDGCVVSSNFAEYRRPLRIKRWHPWLQFLHLDFRKALFLEEKLVFFNIEDALCQKHDLGRLPKENLVLFLWEPPNVLGKMYEERVTRCFHRIYTWNDDLVDGHRFFKFNYPSLRPMTEKIVPFAQKKLCTLVSTCLDHPAPDSLYRERKKAIAFFEEVGEMGFEFYGRGWDAAQHASYRGPIGDKQEAIRHYRFSIAYENMCSQKGYITEKIFDCFAAGNVPVYWGAPNVTDFIPKDCFIDRRDFASLQELYGFLKNMGEEEYNGYLERIRAFLKSEQAKPFSQETFDALFADAVR